MFSKIISIVTDLLRAARENKRAVLPTTAIITISAIVILIGISPNKEEANLLKSIREVETKSVAELLNERAPLPLIGRVRSQSEANLRVETTGEVVSVYNSVGDFVNAGKIIAEISNASERASVLQAEGGVEQAEASLEKLKRGTRDEELSILDINLSKAEDAYSSSRLSAVNTLLSAYSIIDDAILGKADQTFTNSRENNVAFKLPTSNSQLVIKLNSDRMLVEATLLRQEKIRLSISIISDLSDEISKVAEEARFIKEFLDDLISALNFSITTASIDADDVTAFKSAVTIARTNINTTISSITTAESDLSNKLSALRVAEKNKEKGITGERVEDISASEATLKQALGTLRSAQARLEKTFVRTPISGTLNTLSLKRGDFVSALAPAATISNNTALQVETFITRDDKDEIAIGSIALINGKYNGIVTSIAPGLDPLTRKIKVNIGIESTNANLIHGDSVRISISRESKINEESEDKQQRFIVPISTLKVESDHILVFTVLPDNTLSAHKVVEGPLLGDKVVIVEGLTPEMEIVLDARGLRAGDTVILKEN